MNRWRAIGAVFIFVLVAGLIYGYALERQQAAEDAAWTAFAEATMQAPNATTDPAVLLREMAEKHPGTHAAFLARYELMRRHFDANRIEQALEEAEKALRDRPDHSFAPQLRADYARLLEYKGQWEAARHEYETVLALPRPSYLESEAELGRTRCLEEENQDAAARDAYRRLRTLARDSLWPERVRLSAELHLMALNTRPTPLPEEGSSPAKSEADGIEAAETPPLEGKNKPQEK